MKNYIEDLLGKKKNLFKDSYAQMVSEYNSEKKTTKDYNGRQLLELIQNADDAKSDTILIKLNKDERILSIFNKGEPFIKEGYRSLMISDLSSRIKKTYIGNKGLGFRSIINWSDKIRIIGNGIIVVFSEELREQAYFELFDEDARKNINDEFSFEENINPIPFLSIPNVTEIQNSNGFTTTIEIQFKDKDWILEDILNQVTELISEVLLFLNHITKIEFEGFENIDNIEIVGGKKLKQPIKITDKEWIIYEKSGTLDKKYQDNTSKEKEHYQLKIAIPQNFYSETNLLFSFFPTKVYLEFPFVVHGTFDLDSSRNQLIKSDKNKFVLEQLIELIIETVKEISKDKISWRPIELLNYRNENKVLSDLDFYTVINNKIIELDLFPCVDNKYRKLEDTLLYSNDFSTFIQKSYNINIFSNLLIPINHKLEEWLREIGLSFRKLDTYEFVKGIDLLSIKLRTINERVELIYLLENDSHFHSNKEQYSLLLNEEKNIINKNTSVFTPPTTKSESFDLPDFVKIDFLNKDFYRKLLNKFELLNNKEKARELQRKLKKIVKISSFEPVPVIEKIIAEANRQIKKSANKKEANIILKKMIISLFNNYKDLKERTKPDNSKVRIITKSGKARLASELYLSFDYPSGKLTEDLFKDYFSKNYFVASRKTIGLDKEDPTVVEKFLIEFIGINKHTKFISNYSPEKDYESFVFKKINRPDNFRYSSIKVTKIDNIVLIIEKITTEKLILWLLKDTIINQQLNDTYNTDTFKYDKKSEWEDYYYHSINNKPSYVKYQIRSNNSFENILVNSDKLSFINDNNINFKNPLFDKYDITPEDINNVLLELGAKNNFTDFSIERISEIIKSLEKKDSKGKNAQNIYKLAFEHYKKNKQPLILDKETKLFAKINNAYGYHQLNDIYYTDNINLPKKIIEKHAILYFPKRTGELQVSSFFGIKTFKDYEIEIEEKDTDVSITKILTDYLFTLKPYLLAIRLGKISADKQKQINSEVTNLKNLKIEICNSITCSIESNNIELEEFDFIKADDIFYIKSNSLHSLVSLKNNSSFCDVISEIITITFKVNENKSDFRFYFKNNIEDTEHSVISEYSIETLHEAKDLLNMSDYQKEFWQTIFAIKGFTINTKQDLNKQIKENLQIVFSSIIDKIDYQYLSDKNNFEIIKTIFTELKISIYDFNTLSHRKINLTEKHNESLQNFFFSNEKKFKSTLWNYLNKKEKGTQRNFLDLISKFENNGLFIDKKSKEHKEQFKIDSQSILDEFINQNFKFSSLINNDIIDINEKKERNKSQFSNIEKDIIEQDKDLKSLLYFEKNIEIIKEKLQPFILKPDETINEDDNFDEGITIVTDFTVSPVSTPNFKGKGAYTPTDSNKRNKKIGNRSEKKVYIKLVKMFENEYVSWKSKEDEGLHYDIRYSSDKGKRWTFVEVKTFTNNRFYLSKEEKAFGEKNKENYEIWLVKDKDLYPYKMFVDNNFKITANEYIVSIKIDTNE